MQITTNKIFDDRNMELQVKLYKINHNCLQVSLSQIYGCMAWFCGFRIWSSLITKLLQDTMKQKSTKKHWGMRECFQSLCDYVVINRVFTHVKVCWEEHVWHYKNTARKYLSPTQISQICFLRLWNRLYLKPFRQIFTHVSEQFTMLPLRQSLAATIHRNLPNGSC